MFGKLGSLLLVLALFPAAAQAADLRVGAAAEVITPAVGTPMSGPDSSRLVQAVSDDLHAKAIVIELDGVKVALVACDLISMPPEVAIEARRLIGQSPGIPADHVMISATHTHTGPLLLPKPSHNANDAAAAEQVEAYVHALPEHIAAAVRKADAKLAPARVLAGRGTEPRLSFNRRYIMKSGPVGWNPGKLNPNVDRPAGPIDPDVPVVYFESLDKDAKPIATYVSFAMHPDTLHGNSISADYPGRLAGILAKIKGDEMLTFFATGACGDVNHVNVNFRGGQIGAKETAKIGMVLAGEVLKAYARVQPIHVGPIRTKSEVVTLPLPAIKPGEIEQSEAELAKPASPGLSLPRLHAQSVLTTAARKGKPLEVEVQVIALGDDLAWVALPGEMFAELGLDVKKRSPFKHTIIVELANGSIGYIPAKHAYAEGNYEPTVARCGPGSGEMLVESAIRLLDELKTDGK